MWESYVLCQFCRLLIILFALFLREYLAPLGFFLLLFVVYSTVQNAAAPPGEVFFGWLTWFQSLFFIEQLTLLPLEMMEHFGALLASSDAIGYLLFSGLSLKISSQAFLWFLVF